jgi:hypothetical protein
MSSLNNDRLRELGDILNEPFTQLQPCDVKDLHALIDSALNPPGEIGEQLQTALREAVLALHDKGHTIVLGGACDSDEQNAYGYALMSMAGLLEKHIASLSHPQPQGGSNTAPNGEQQSTVRCDQLVEAAEHAREVLSTIYAKYGTKIGPYSSQAQQANVELGAALSAHKASDVTKAEGVRFAWLIELRGMVPMWWAAEGGWEENANDALWFARRVDADRFASEMSQDVFVAEHGFHEHPTPKAEGVQCKLCGGSKYVKDRTQENTWLRDSYGDGILCHDCSRPTPVSQVPPELREAAKVRAAELRGDRHSACGDSADPCSCCRHLDSAIDLLERFAGGCP